LLVLALLLLAFAGIAKEVSEGDSASFDRAIILAFRTAGDISNPIGPPWMEEAARDITALGSTIVVGLICCAIGGYLLLSKQHNQAVILFVSALGGLALNSFLKLIFERPRPDLVPPLSRVFTTSFPSGHAALSSVAYLTIAALLASTTPSYRIRLYFMAVAALVTIAVGISRVYLGLHYPTDVLAGWCIGPAWALMCWVAANRFRTDAA
jgi:undecaprenyl-diphosphatase